MKERVWKVKVKVKHEGYEKADKESFLVVAARVEDVLMEVRLKYPDSEVLLIERVGKVGLHVGK